MTTEVVVKCISKKEMQNWNEKHPIATEIELAVPYDQNSIYYQLSGGTATKLCTINKSAADMFVIGQDYKITIAPAQEG